MKEAYVSELLKSADRFADKAEHVGNLALISKSNSLRRSAKDKQVELETLQKVINEKLSKSED